MGVMVMVMVVCTGLFRPWGKQNTIFKNLSFFSTGDEADGYDETLCPSDFNKVGQIVDDDIYTMLVKPMAPDVNVTVLVRSPLLLAWHVEMDGR